jgi:hypothetical protein
MLLSLLKTSAISVGGKISSAVKSKKLRVDENLPLGLRIGGMVEFCKIKPRILASEFTFNCETSEEGKYDYLSMQGTFPESMREVIAYSKRINDGFCYYKFYLSDEAGFLEIVTENDVIIEDGIKFFSLSDEIIPDSLDEMDYWIPSPETSQTEDSNWWIGNQFFQLPEQELDDDGIWTDYGYSRFWSPGDQIIEPIIIKEDIIIDSFGETVQNITHDCMMYGRRSANYVGEDDFPDNAAVEWAFVTAVTVNQSISIEVFVGYNLTESDMTIY